MITINNSPILNSINADANELIIDVNTTNGFTHYLRAEISLDGVLFKVQSWGKYDGYNAKVSLQNLLQNFFEIDNTPNIVNGITYKNLVKRVSIQIKEYLLSNDSLVDTEVVPDFYMIKSYNPEVLNLASDIEFVADIPNLFKCPKDAYISIPFFISNANISTIQVSVTDDQDNIIYSYSVNSSGIGFHVFNLSLSSIVIPYEVKSIKFTITFNTITIEKTILIEHLPVYLPTKIYFENNYGIFQYAYFFGESQKERKYSRESYNVSNNQLRNFETTTDIYYKINTGYFSKDQIKLIDMINKSLNVQISDQGPFVEVRQSTSKFTEPTSNEYVIDEEITFIRKE